MSDYATVAKLLDQMRERAEKAEAKAAQFESDWMEAKHEFGCRTKELVTRAEKAESERDEANESCAAAFRSLEQTTAALEKAQARLAHLDELIAVDDPMSLADYPATDTDALKLYEFATRAARDKGASR